MHNKKSAEGARWVSKGITTLWQVGERGRAEPSLKSRTASKATLFGWSAFVSLGLTDERKMRALGKRPYKSDKRLDRYLY